MTERTGIWGVFTIRLSLHDFQGPSEFQGGGGVEHPNPPPRYATDVQEMTRIHEKRAHNQTELCLLLTFRRSFKSLRVVAYKRL